MVFLLQTGVRKEYHKGKIIDTVYSGMYTIEAIHEDVEEDIFESPSERYITTKIIVKECDD